MRKPVTFILLLLILTQSCVVYHDTTVSLEEAVDNGWVLITDNDGTQFKYKKIIKKDSVYYGLDHVPSNSIIIDMIPFKTAIDTTEIKSIQLKDKKKSNKNQFLGAAGSLVLLGLFLFLLTNSF